MKKKVLLSSIATIALCLCLIAGSTYALFTSNSEVNIAVTAGKVDMVAGIEITKLESVKSDANGTIVDEKGNTYSYEEVAPNFTNGGTAVIDGSVLTLEKITPGDKITLAISGANDSDVGIKYRYVVECVSGYRLMDGLVITIGNDTYTSMASYTSAWAPLAAETDMADVAISIELPVKAGNEYQEQTAQIKITVEAVQGNAAVDTATEPTVVSIPKVTDANGIAAALAAGESEIILGADVELTEALVVNAPVTIDLNGNTLTSTAKKAIELHADATIKGGTIVGANRCVDTRTAVDLKLEDVTLIADKYSSAYGNPQPITIGGSTNGTKVTMDNVTVSADAGYCIIAFVECDVTAIDSTFGGYNALYVKPGAENSVFNFINCDITASTGNNDVEGNSFSAIAIQTDNVTVNVDADSSITAIGNYCDAVSLGWVQDKYVEGNVVNVKCPVKGNKLSVDNSCADKNTVNFAQ